MKCKKCNSENVKVAAVSNVKSKGGATPLWYWFGFVCLFDIFLLGAIHRSFKHTKTKVKTIAVCQDCGHSWKV